MHRFAVSLVACFAFTAAARAELRMDVPELESDDMPVALAVFEEPIYFSVAGGYTSQFATDLMTGDYDVSRFDFSVSAQTKLSDNLDVSVIARVMVDSYEFSSMSSLGLGSAPWEDIFTFSFGARMRYKLNDKWSLEGGPVVQFSREDGADWSDSVTFGGSISAVYQWNDDLAIGLGIGAISQIEDDALIIPIFIVEWKINDTLRISNNAPTATGVGGELIWTFAPTWELALGAGYSSRRFRLDDVGIAPGGVGEETAFPVSLRVGWNPTEQIHVSVYGGVNFATTLTLESSTGARIAREEPDGALFLGFAARIRF